MLSAEWPKASCIGKKRKREERKKERKEKEKKEKRKKKRKKKRRKRERKRKEKKRGWGKETNQKAKQNDFFLFCFETKRNNNNNKKKHGGVSSDSVYFKSLDFPWNLSV